MSHLEQVKQDKALGYLLFLQYNDVYIVDEDGYYYDKKGSVTLLK